VDRREHRAIAAPDHEIEQARRVLSALVRRGAPGDRAAEQRGEADGERVHVGAEGTPLEVTIAKSSGYARLDEIARETVLRSWRFVPARQGEQAVAGTVRVPIDFSLNS